MKNMLYLEYVLFRLHTEYVAICFYYLYVVILSDAKSVYSLQISTTSDNDIFILEWIILFCINCSHPPAKEYIFDILNSKGFLLPD